MFDSGIPLFFRPHTSYPVPPNLVSNTCVFLEFNSWLIGAISPPTHGAVQFGNNKLRVLRLVVCPAQDGQRAKPPFDAWQYPHLMF